MAKNYPDAMGTGFVITNEDNYEIEIRMQFICPSTKNKATQKKRFDIANKDLLLNSMSWDYFYCPECGQDHKITIAPSLFKGYQ